jgi:ABC-type multidrug transport system ATPase subunit
VTPSPPLLRSLGPRLSGAGLELGSFEANGPLLVLVGGWGPLFELLAGRRQLSDGQLEVGGATAQAAAGRAGLGLLLRDAALPPSWTLGEVMLESARLLGSGRWRASRQARRALDELGLRELGGKRLARLRPGEQRAAALACATLGEPSVLALEEPLSGLEPSEQALVAGVLERACRGRQALVSVRELPGSPSEAALAARSSELLFISERRLVARGTYPELSSRTHSYRVVVRRSVDALLSALVETGYEVRRMFSSEATTLWVADTTGLGTLPLLRAALAADAPIIELVSSVFSRPAFDSSGESKPGEPKPAPSPAVEA